MKLAVIEVLDRDGHVRTAVPVMSWPVTIGRAIDCDVVLDDEHVAPLHVTVTHGDGGLGLVVGDSINGVRLKGRQLAAQQSGHLPSGDVFQAGHTRLRVRLASDVLAPERPFVPEPTGGRMPLVALIFAVLGWSLAGHWVNTDPGTRLTDYLPVLLGLPVLLAAWSGMWAVGSKLVRHRFDFLRHTRIAFFYTFVGSAIDLALPVASFALGWPLLSRVSGFVSGAVSAGMVLAHLTLILPLRRKVLTVAAVGLFTVGVSLLMIRNYQVKDRLFGELYVTTLAPPAFRVASPVTTTRFIEEARDLKAILDAHVGDEDNGDAWGEAFDASID